MGGPSKPPPSAARELPSANGNARLPSSGGKTTSPVQREQQRSKSGVGNPQASAPGTYYQKPASPSPPRDMQQTRVPASRGKQHTTASSNAHNTGAGRAAAQNVSSIPSSAHTRPHPASASSRRTPSVGSKERDGHTASSSRTPSAKQQQQSSSRDAPSTRNDEGGGGFRHMGDVGSGHTTIVSSAGGRDGLVTMRTSGNSLNIIPSNAKNVQTGSPAADGENLIPSSSTLNVQAEGALQQPQLPSSFAESAASYAQLQQSSAALNTKLQQSCAELQQLYDAKCDEHADLISQIRTLHSDLLYIREKAKGEVKDRDYGMEWKNSADSLESSQKNFISRLDDLTQKLEQKQELESDWRTVLTENNEFQKKLNDAQTRIHDLEKLVMREDQQKEEYEEQVRKLEGTNGALEEMQVKQKGEIEILNGQVAEARMETAEAQAQAAKAQSEATRLRAQLRASKKCIQEATCGETKMSHALLLVDERARRLSREVDDMKRKSQRHTRMSEESASLPPVGSPTQMEWKKMLRLNAFIRGGLL